MPEALGLLDWQKEWAVLWGLRDAIEVLFKKIFIYLMHQVKEIICNMPDLHCIMQDLYWGAGAL